jgi:hypothetical protein
MMNRSVLIVSSLLFILFLNTTVFGQDASECPTIIETALETVGTVCADIGRNEVCYGNPVLEVFPRLNSEDFVFDQVGDRVNLSSISQLQLRGMDVEESIWGIAVLNVQANLPDTLPGQNVTFLLLGDVQIINRSVNLIELFITTRYNANIRSHPNTDDNNVIQSITANSELRANGRLEDNSWVRVIFEDGRIGWISSAVISGRLDDLQVVRVGDPTYRPMQAFQFSSGLGYQRCSAAPANGILIQTPEGSVEVELNINGIDLHLGSTAFIQAQPNDYLYVYLFEGSASVTAQGVSQIIPPGTVVKVPLDENSLPAGIPEYPQPYTRLEAQTPPVEILPNEITVANPVSADEVAGAIDIANGLPPAGRWRSTTEVTNLNLSGCPESDDGSKPPTGSVYSVTYNFTFSEDRSTLFEDTGDTVHVFRRINDFTYLKSDYPGDNFLITFTSPTTMVGQMRTSDDSTCIWEFTENVVYIGN